MMEGRLLGDYHIIKQVGQGSLGTTWLAEHRFMKRQYIIKIFPEELSQDRSFIQRFEEEVKVLAQLDHPRIVKIHNISFAEGRYFLVLDCVVDSIGETVNIAQYIQSKGGVLPNEEVQRILSHIAEALDYAHSKKGIIHRGIKLNNILIGKGQDGVNAYLSDFGLSRIIGHGAVLTRTFKSMADSLSIKVEEGKFSESNNDLDKVKPLLNSFIQSYAFLAPEQKSASSQLGVDSKVDIYAFGVLAYFLANQSFPEGIFEIPQEWAHVITYCLQSDPKNRPQSLSALLNKPQSHSFEEVKQVVQEKVKVSVSGELKPVIHSPELKRPEHDPNPASVFQLDTTVKQYQPISEEKDPIEPIQTDMIVVEGGTFWRGSDDGSRDEKPRHQVHLSSFALDVHPVTNEQFVCFLEVMGGIKDENHNDIIRLRDSRIKRSAGRFSIESGYVKHPVVGVTWYGACAYAKWVGKRLPTEAEWEIASRGGDENALYPTGDDIEKSQANFFSSDTTAVKSYAANGAGLFDMAGNVYEWCQDWYGYNYYDLSVQEPEEPKGPVQGVYRVLRGGCWKSLKEDLRCSRRHRNNPGTVNGTYGFRCAADVR